MAPGWPRATRKRSRPDRGGVRLQLIIYTGIPYPVPFGYKRQSSYEVRTKAATAMNSDEASHPRGRSRERRPAESDERREARLHRRRERSRERRATESPQHREERLAKRRRRDKAKRMARSTNRHQRRQQLCSESTESRESRLQQMRLNQQRVLATETPEETEAVKVKVIEVKNEEKMKNGLIKQECVVSDSTGTARITAWEDNVDLFVENNSYSLTGVTVRSFKGKSF